MEAISTDFPLTKEQIDHYNKHGYVFVRNFFSKEELEPLKLACEDDPELRDSRTLVDYGGSGFKLSVWTELGNSLLGVLPRMARIVDASEALEGEKCYHWHSKIVLKRQGEGEVRWHQGFGTWYEDTCLYPKMVSCCIAVNENTRENGCLQIAKDSHHLGRLDNVMIGNSCATDPKRLEIVHERLEHIQCEMQQGDVVFFHANTLHGSDVNTTDSLRTLLFCTYNVVSNEPYNLENQQHHRYRPLNKLPDSVLLEKQYEGVFETQQFHEKETDNSPGTGVGIRHGRTTKATV